jgi:hypothetical protein
MTAVSNIGIPRYNVNRYQYQYQHQYIQIQYHGHDSIENLQCFFTASISYVKQLPSMHKYTYQDLRCCLESPPID